MDWLRMNRRTWIRTLLDADDGGGGGGGSNTGKDDTPASGNKPKEEPNADGDPEPPKEPEKPKAPEQVEKILAKLSEEERTALNEHERGLKTALETERTERVKLEKQINELRDEVKSELRLETAEARARHALEEGNNKEELEAAQRELREARQELEQRKQRDVFRDALKKNELTRYEDLLLQVRFGTAEDVVKALEHFKTARREDIAAEVERRLPNLKPPGETPETSPKTVPDYGYEW